MVRPSDAIVWNEQLVQALRYREDQSRRQGKRSALQFSKAIVELESVRGDIYAFRNGRVVNLPSQKLSKTIDGLCRRIIAGQEPVLPPGYVPVDDLAASTIPGQNRYRNDPYLKSIKKRGGAYAILLAFHVSGNDVMTKQQIIDLAQNFCDEQMESNYHAGRVYGAWSSSKTLLSHNFITAQHFVGYSQRAGGVRSMGPSKFAITTNGKEFIQALLEKNSDISEEIESVRQRQQLPQMQQATRHNIHQEFVDPFGVNFIPRSPLNSKRLPNTKLTNQDERQLRDFVQNANVGEQKEFAVGEDRRKRLHDLCDALNANELAGTGTQLRHESVGSKTHRSMFVTLLHQPTTATVTPTKTNPQRVRGYDAEYILEDSPTPKKRPPAKVAAAQAALHRQALFESTTQKIVKKSTSTTLPVMIDLIDDEYDNISDAEQDVKMPAKVFPVVVNPYKQHTTRRTTTERTLSFDTDDEDDAILQSVLTLSKDPIDLTESQEVNIILDTKQLAVDPVRQLTIYIDDRERNRNATPRMMRIELSRLLSTGPLSRVWPKSFEPGLVEEFHLPMGDFCFGVSPVSGGIESKNILPVIVERKRIGDIVQRSNRKDHWYQLQRMREYAGMSGERVNILLLEGDSRSAIQYEPYGAQAVETVSSYTHVIDNEESLYLFFGRLILRDLGNTTRFLQTKEEQGSLRAVAALGLMSMTSSRIKKDEGFKDHKIDLKTEHTKLKDRLQQGGIPYDISSRISDEMGSCKNIDHIYAMTEDEECRNRLFAPLIADICSQAKLRGTPHGWSAAIHRLWFSAISDPKVARDRFDQVCHLVENHAMLLEQLHSGLSVDVALDEVLSGPELVENVHNDKRTVLIESPASFQHTFPLVETNQKSFYEFHETKSSTSAMIPVITMQTREGPYVSTRLFIYLIDGDQIVQELQERIINEQDFVSVARSIAEHYAHDLANIQEGRSPESRDRKILLIRGLNNALDQAAKASEFRSEVRVLGKNLYRVFYENKL
jgi:ERCC4-type nuclease